MGPVKSDYIKVAPPNSFIHVRDFISPQHLATFLQKVGANENQYLSFFQWKRHGSISSSSLWCKLCLRLHDVGAPHWYKDVSGWWGPDAVCDPPDFSDFTLDVMVPNLVKKGHRAKE